MKLNVHALISAKDAAYTNGDASQAEGMESQQPEVATGFNGEVVYTPPTKPYNVRPRPAQLPDPNWYPHYLIREFGINQLVPSKVFMDGRVYHLASARFQGRALSESLSCKFSLERNPGHAPRKSNQPNASTR